MASFLAFRFLVAILIVCSTISTDVKHKENIKLMEQIVEISKNNQPSSEAQIYTLVDCPFGDKDCLKKVIPRIHPDKYQDNDENKLATEAFRG